MVRRAGVLRFFALAVAALLCAFIAGLIVVPAPWHDPFVWMIWIRVTLFCAAIGFAYATFTLWDTRLTHSIPIVLAATIAGAVLGAAVFAVLSPVAALVAGLAAMGWCRRRATQPSEPSRPLGFAGRR